MKIVNCRRSEIDSNIMIAEVKCSNCGHVTTTTCKAITELRKCVCSVCGNVDYEEKDGRTYKEAEEAIEQFKQVGKKAAGFRSGTERMVRTYYKMLKRGVVDLETFPDKESFVVWSIQHGYKDWKTLKASPVTNKIDTTARWEVSGYGTKGAVDTEKIADESDVKSFIAKSVGVALVEMSASISKALVNIKEISDKYNVIDEDEDTAELRYRLNRMQEELASIENELESKF